MLPAGQVVVNQILGHGFFHAFLEGRFSL